MLRRIKESLFGEPPTEVEVVSAGPVAEEKVEVPKPDLVRVVELPDPPNVQDQIVSCYKDITGTFESFRLLVDALNECDRVDVHPLCQFKPRRSDKRVNVGLRVDIDADANTAVNMARYCARVGIGSSFYLLTTALYYGHYERDLLVRSPELKALLEDLIVSGCEVGLHNDVMHVAATTDLDPISAMWTELHWLRSNGVNIQGTVGHNSIVVYGAENSEVFKDRVLWDREVKSPSGNLLPLGLVDEASFGLFYEGTYAKVSDRIDVEAAQAFARCSENASLRNEDWMRRYLTDNPCHDWDVDIQIWAIGRDRWTVGGGNTFLWDIELTEVIEAITDSAFGKDILIVLHPEYFRD